MPTFVQGNPEATRMLDSADYGYQYPNNVNLRPGSNLHEKLRTAIYNRAQESYRIIQRRFDAWNRIDETLTVYMPLSEEERLRKDADSRTPVSIVVPYSYAQLDTIVTYLIAAFCQDPIFRYEGVGPEDVIGAQILELLIQNQCNKFKIGIPLHTMFRDAVSYGIGIVAPNWTTCYGKKVVRKKTGVLSYIAKLMGMDSFPDLEESILYEGNALENIDPYRFLPDPNYGIQDIQKGDFVGWLTTTSLMDLMSEERTDNDLFNVRYLKGLNSRRSTLFSSDESGRDRYSMNARYAISEQHSQPVDSIEMIMKIIPKEYGLKGDRFNPNGEYPEKWHFTLAADQVIIRAKPLGLNHNMFPVCVCAPDFDGRTIAPISRLEILSGLQEHVNFLFNSHIANVSKVINDMLVVDPYLVNMNDLKDPKPGKLIRLRRSAWGRGTSEVVTQLKVVDVTQNNVADAQRTMDIMDRVSAATHNMMGIMRPGSERRSAAEFEGTQGAAMNRLERMAKVIGLMAMQDIGYMFASHTQQFLSDESYIKIAGRFEKELIAEYGSDVQNGRLLVEPDTLAINYDVYVRDGSVPGGNFSQAWVQIFQAVGANPVLASRIDVFRLFKHLARNLGAKDIEEFELKVQQQGLPAMQPQIMPDQMVQQQAQSGNIVPMGGQNVA